MSSNRTLTVREAFRLAKENKLSLELRLQWQRIAGTDPYDRIRLVILRRNFWWAVGAGVVILLVGLFTSRQLAGTPIESELEKVMYLLFFQWLILFVCAAALEGQPTDPGGTAKRFCQQLSRVLRAYQLSFMTCTLPEVSEKIALFDLTELRECAKRILVGRALAVLEHDETGPDCAVDVVWSSAKTELITTFRQAYDAFASFNLAYGGYDHFFGEAKKELTGRARAERPTPAEVAVEAN